MQNNKYYEMIKKKFRVDSHSPEENIICLTLLEGEKKGLDFGFPTSNPEYSEVLESQISDLEKGDEINTIIKSMNKQNTSWRFIEINILSK